MYFYSNKWLYEEAKIIPLDRYLLQSAKILVGNISNHPNQVRMTAQQRHSEPRYLCALGILDEHIISMGNGEAVTFYADTQSEYSRG